MDSKSGESSREDAKIKEVMMLRKGTRVVVIDDVSANMHGAIVRNGDEGIVAGPGHLKGSVRVSMDESTNSSPWYIPILCLKRIRNQRSNK